MTERGAVELDSSKAVDRRAFFTTLGIAISGSIAGCTDESERDTRSRDEENTDSPEVSGKSYKATEIKRKTGLVFENIQKAPVVDDGKFVYDLENAVRNVDYEEIVGIALEALAAAEELDNENGDISDGYQAHVTDTARLAFLLADQRFLIHHTLLAGVAFRRAFSEAKYERAVEVIGEGREFLDRLWANGGEIEKVLDGFENSDLTMAELDDTTIRNDLEVLKEVLRWSTPVFEGFEYTATGMVAVQEGNQELGQERYGTARGHYEQAQEDFTKAETAFDTAHGRGVSIDDLASILNDLRCLVPTLGNGYDDLDDAFAELEMGNEDEGMEMARETLRRMDGEFKRCIQ